MKVFISGSMSIKELPEIAIREIDRLLADEPEIIIGDAPGVDKAVQEYLAKKDYKKVTVYYTFDKPRHNIGNWNTHYVDPVDRHNPRACYFCRDNVMANVADIGLAIWDNKSQGTKRNIVNMLLQSKDVRLIVNNGSGFILAELSSKEY